MPTGLTAIALMATACAPPQLQDRPFDQVAVATTHNAMSNRDDGWLVPSQEHDIPRQLRDGVRGLMLDIHMHEEQAWLCHSSCSMGSQPLAEGLTEIHAFLRSEPTAVVTLILENYATASELENAFADSGLLSLAHHHDSGQSWPSRRELLAAGERVVVLTDSDRGELPWLLDLWSLSWETHWSAESADDLTCAMNRGSEGNALFILNHFVTHPVSLPEQAALVNENPFFEQRALGCLEESGVMPNFVTVDFYDIGDVFGVVDALNEAWDD